MWGRMTPTKKARHLSVSGLFCLFWLRGPDLNASCNRCGSASCVKFDRREGLAGDRQPRGSARRGGRAGRSGRRPLRPPAWCRESIRTLAASGQARAGAQRLLQPGQAALVVGLRPAPRIAQHGLYVVAAVAGRLRGTASRERSQPPELRRTFAGAQSSSYLCLRRSATTGAGGRTTASPATGALGIE